MVKLSKQQIILLHSMAINKKGETTLKYDFKK